LRREHLSFRIANLQMRQLRYFLNIGFGYRHNGLFIYV
jgi:hypothetical protein